MSCVRGCCPTQGEHYRSIIINPAGPGHGTLFERQLDKDRPAYKRMRDEGLQPKSLKGAAEIEKRATTRFEVESGRILPEPLAKRMDAAQAEAKQVIASGGV